MKSVFRGPYTEGKQACLSQTRLALIAQIALSAILGMALSVSLYSHVLMSLFPPTSKRAILLTVALALAAMAAFFLLLRRLAPIFSSLTVQRKLATVVLSLLLGAALLFAGTHVLQSTPQGIAFLLPEQSVEISAPIAQLLPNPQLVLLYFKTPLEEVSYNRVDYRGWTRVGSELRLTDWSDNHFIWTGKTGGRVALVFQRSPRGGFVDVSWGGFTERVNLRSDDSGKYLYVHDYPIPFYASRGMILLLTLLLYAFGVFGLFLRTWSERDAVQLSWLRATAALKGQPSDEQTTGILIVLVFIVIMAVVLRALYLGGPT